MTNRQENPLFRNGRMIETKKLLRNGDRILKKKKKNSSEMQKEKRQTKKRP